MNRNEMERVILSFFDLNKDKKYKLQELYNLFELKEEDKTCFNDALIKLQMDSKLYLNDYKEYMHFPIKSDLVVGTLKINKQGKYYILAFGKVFFIDNNYLNGAIKGDIVLVNKLNKGFNSKVKSIIYRDTNKIIVDCVNNNGAIALIPYNKDFKFNITLNNNDLKTLVDGDRIALKLEELDKNNYKGNILYYVGHKDDPNIEIKTMAILDDIDVVFPKEVIEEANNLPKEVSEKDFEGRLDYRKKLIFTIDGKDTKDMDDAVSLEINEKGNYVLGVHIADVSYYVKENSLLFKEAYKRATSIYPANFVIPMFPHVLSNGICSLNPNVDRLTLSCIMEIDKEGNVISSKIEESVINSKKKMSYEEVNKILEKKEHVPGYEEYETNLKMMQELHQLLNKKKIIRGYIDFGDSDIKTTIDEHGKVIGIKKIFRGISERIIEDFMLLANEEVAKQIPFIYRVHEHPDEDKINEIITTINELGYKIKPTKSVQDPHVIQGILRQISNLEIFPILSEMILQGMKRAFYSINNIGHFGLALRDYTHFTSPIRRFPDLMVHLMIKKMKQNKIISSEELKKLEESCIHCSSKQKQADTFEKKINFLSAAKYMDDHKNDEFLTTICYIGTANILVCTEEGIYGKILLGDLNEHYKFVPSQMCLKNENSELHLGNKISIKVKSINTSDRKIFFKEFEPKPLVRERKKC